MFNPVREFPNPGHSPLNSVQIPASQANTAFYGNTNPDIRRVNFHGFVPTYPSVNVNTRPLTANRFCKVGGVLAIIVALMSALALGVLGLFRF